MEYLQTRKGSYAHSCIMHGFLLNTACIFGKCSDIGRVILCGLDACANYIFSLFN